MDVTSFFVETRVNNLNPYNFFREFVISCHASHGVSSPEVEPSKGSRTKEDQLLSEALDMVGSMGSEDEED